MRNLNKFGGIFLIVFVLTLNLFGQTAALPRFRKGEDYAKVRVKMMRAGWKPYHAKDADQCMDGDSRCQGRPEMHACAGTGLANCEFLWKRGSKQVAIYTVGEVGGSYSGYRFQ